MGLFLERGTLRAFKPFIFQKATAIKDNINASTTQRGRLPVSARYRCNPPNLSDPFVSIAAPDSGTTRFSPRMRRHWAAPWPSAASTLSMAAAMWASWAPWRSPFSTSGGHVTGIIPDFLKSREKLLEDVQETIVVPDMHTRKRLMFEKADAFVALPGRNRHPGGTRRADDLGAARTAHQADPDAQHQGLLEAAADPFRPYARPGFHPPRTGAQLSRRRARRGGHPDAGSLRAAGGHRRERGRDRERSFRRMAVLTPPATARARQGSSRPRGAVAR